MPRHLVDPHVCSIRSVDLTLKKKMATRVSHVMTRQPVSLCPSSPPSDEELDKLMSLSNGFLNELIELVHQHRVNDDAFLSDVLTEKRSHWGLIVSEVNIPSILTRHSSPFADRVSNQLSCLNQAIYEEHWDGAKILFECKCLQAMIKALLDTWRPGLDMSDRVLVYSDTDDTTGLDCTTDIEKDGLYDGGNLNVNINFSMHSRLQYAHLLKTKENFDVTFLVNNQTIKAHRIILAAQSNYFDRLLFGEMSEGSPSSTVPIVLKDVRVSSFQLLMCFAYTGFVELKSAQLEGVLELLEVADRFCFVKLKDALSKKLSSVITVSSVLPIFVTADHLSLNELCHSCLHFADRHAVEVLKEEIILSLPQDTLISLLSRDSFAADELEIYNCIKTWMTHNSVSSCPPLLECVRLSEIPAAELLDLASPHGQFTESQVIIALRVQMKKLVGESRPRGRCEFGKNLFDLNDSAKIKDSISWKQISDDASHNQAPPTARQQGFVVPQGFGSQYVFGTQQALGGGNRRRQTSRLPQGPMYTSGISLLTYVGTPEGPLNKVIVFGDRKNLQYPPQFDPLSHPFSSSSSSRLVFTVVLNDLYLINSLSFEYHPEEDTHDPVSYVVEISSGAKNDWLQLMDYSEFPCYGKQELRFPKQAVRYIRLSSASMSQSQVAIRLLSCSLEEAHTIPTKYCNNGLMGPLSYVSPVALETTKSDKEIVWHFKTPLVITTAKFVLERHTMEQSVIVLVKWGVNETMKEKKIEYLYSEKNYYEVIFEFGEKEEAVTLISAALVQLEDIATAVTFKNLQVMNKFNGFSY